MVVTHAKWNTILNIKDNKVGNYLTGTNWLEGDPTELSINYKF